jgi:predicted GIY-YIG superfamily endonuclease
MVRNKSRSLIGSLPAGRQGIQSESQSHLMVKSTAYYSPWKLFYYEEFTNRTEGRIREKYLKGGSGKELIKKKWSETNHEV